MSHKESWKTTLNQIRLANECAKLDPALERDMAEDGLTEDLENWPKY